METTNLNNPNNFTRVRSKSRKKNKTRQTKQRAQTHNRTSRQPVQNIVPHPILRDITQPETANHKAKRILRQTKQTNERVQICKTKCKDYEKTINDCVITNTTLSFRDCTNPGKTLYHYVRPCELSVDSLQYAFNNDLVSIITEGDNQYLSIKDFPTLLVETTTIEKSAVEIDKLGKINDNDNDNFKDTRRDNGFYDVYEDALTIKDSYEKHLEIYKKSGMYKNAVKYKNQDMPDIPENYSDGISTQDINYVKYIAESLQKGKPEEYKCDLEGIDEKYIITENMIIGDGDSKEEFVICGYPDPSKMRTYLNLLKDENIKTQINDIHIKHKTEFAQLFADMHNFITTEQDKKIINIETELYKFVPNSINITYMKKWYEQNPELHKWIESDEFKEKIKYMEDNGLYEHKEMIMKEIAKSLIPVDEYDKELDKLNKSLLEYDKYINELLLEYLNKPMMRIRYYFLIFKKTIIDGIISLVPAVFNIKQLESKHKPILEKVLDLIQIRIPEIFGILKDSRNKLDRYKLFHSYVKYGDFFYITTEYLHIMTNMSH
jgi:hypothetical protein